MARTASPQSTPVHQEQCEKWLAMLLHTNRTDQTTEALSEYFFQECARQPRIFFSCLLNLGERLTSLPPVKRKHLAAQYLSVLSPLCERFGLFEEKNALDVVCFAITEPDHANTVENILQNYRQQSGVLLRRIDKTIGDVLRSQGLTHTLQGRYKNPWSIWKKLKKRGSQDPLKLKDIFAFRIILSRDDPAECYEVLHLLHDTFHPVPGSFKDYISIPKINGYQSIHTVLYRIIPDFPLPVEIQIRTKSMHEFAEHGMASHWLYSRRKRTVLLNEKERRLLKHVAELSTEAQEKNCVHCLSPVGDIYTLPLHSTVVDFAYRIHTDIGNRITAARVNGKLQDIRYVIQECDRIQVLLGESRQVHQDWLRFVTTAYARKRIYEFSRS